MFISRHVGSDEVEIDIRSTAKVRYHQEEDGYALCIRPKRGPEWKQTKKRNEQFVPELLEKLAPFDIPPLVPNSRLLF